MMIINHSDEYLSCFNKCNIVKFIVVYILIKVFGVNRHANRRITKLSNHTKKQ